MNSSNISVKLIVISAMAFSLLVFAVGQNYDPYDSTIEKSIPIPSKIIREVELKLSQKGHKISKIDGIIDRQTSKAIRDFQEKEKLQVTSKLNKETLDKLGVDYNKAINYREGNSFAE